MKKYKKLFVVFEGIDTSGKTTTLKNLSKFLTDSNIKHFVTREPGGGVKNSFSESIRKIIIQNKNINPLTELFLFQASRSEHVEKEIIPNLEKQHVICDRYIYSTLVYQKIKGVRKDIIDITNEVSTFGLLPDIVFFLDINEKTFEKRIRNKNCNRLDEESIKMFTLIRKEYLNLAEKSKNIFVINANKTEEEVLEEILTILKREHEKNIFF